MEQRKTPLYTALINHVNSEPTSFHVPGHKNGKTNLHISENYFSDILKIDVTELTGLDDLHSPNGVIQEAQQLTANLYGVNQSYFLVSGSTVGNLAMILTACNQGDKVLVQRNCHKSVIHGLQLAGVSPVFLSPTIATESQIPIGITQGILKKAIRENNNIAALILTYPNYYGMASHEIREIIKVAHQYNIPVLIDEAHGAHFCLKETFPLSSIELGADIVVHSAHKTLPAMTMGSFIHFNSKLLKKGKLEFYLQMLQSSSPSYPIMASLDIARHYLASISKGELDIIEQKINSFKEELNEIPQIKVINEKVNFYTSDLLKVTIKTQCQLSGYEIQLLLEKRGIFTELADPYHVLFIFPLDSKAEYKKVTQVIKEELGGLRTNNVVIPSLISGNDISTLSLTYNDMLEKDTKCIPVKESVGYISACNVIPYPPGIPCIIRGERITSYHIAYLLEMKAKGASFQRGKELWENGIEVFC